MKTRKRPGQTLIEVTMAALISAITTTAVFSVILSSFVADDKTDKRDSATMALKHAQDTLKSYVSAVPTTADMFPGSLPVKPGAPVSPLGVGRWARDNSGAWALQAGDHNISSLCIGTPLNQAGACVFTYRVTNINCLGLAAAQLTDFNQCKTVRFTLTFTD